MSQLKYDLTGNRYNRLTVQRRAIKDEISSNSKDTHWICICDCGNKTVSSSYALRIGISSSCGCYRKELQTTHGKTYTQVYEHWLSMWKRCKEKGTYVQKKGITICDRWKSFENFYEDMGDPKPGMTIDRIDNTKGYSPDNCRWATTKEQSLNKDNTLYITYKGETRTVMEWSKIVEINYKTLWARLYKYEWSVSDALEK